jgi:hypothetical protein
MNLKSQTLGLAIISTIVILIIGLLVVNYLTDEIDRTRLDLNCANAGDISDGNKLLCLGIDTTVIYWIILILSVVIGGIVSQTKLS